MSLSNETIRKKREKNFLRYIKFLQYDGIFECLREKNVKKAKNFENFFRKKLNHFSSLLT